MYGTYAGPDGPPGCTYAAVLVSAGDSTGAALPTALREIRFTGWLAPAQDGWLVAVAASGAGTVAAGRRGVAGLGEWLARRLGTTVLAVRVLTDRQLVLAAWTGDDEVGRYVSDPAREPDADEDVLPDPLGAEHADAFAAACGRPEAAADLAEVLAEEIDPESVIESERLARVLRLLRLPTWLVAADALPRDIPTGPDRRELTRLGAGLAGPAGRCYGAVVEVMRRRRRPPPVVADAPRGSGGPDPWLM